MKPLSAIVAGHICLDIIPQFDPARPFDFAAQLQPGSLTRVGPAIFSTGGAVSNTGQALHRLGIPTTLIARTGDDLFGQAIRQLVARSGPSLVNSLAVVPGAVSSYTIILSPPGVDRLFIHCPGANDEFGPQDLPSAALAKADLFHFGYPPVMRRMYQDGGAGLLALFQRVKASGGPARSTGSLTVVGGASEARSSTASTTCLDLCMPDPASEAGQADWRTILAAVLPWVDIFTPSLDELLFMLDRPAYHALQAAGMRSFLKKHPALPHQLGQQMLAMGARIVLLKLGDCGACLCTANARSLANLGRAAPAGPAAWAHQALWAPVFKVELGGATGSGDATIAGFLSAFLRGLPPTRALTTAVAVGACNVEAPDALSGIPDWDAVQQRIAAGWPRRKPFEKLEGWAWDEAEQVWVRG